MTHAPLLAAPVSSVFRHQRFDGDAQWRCQVQPAAGAPRPALRRRAATVVGQLSMGPVVTSYEVRFDDGTRCYVWPASVVREPDADLVAAFSNVIPFRRPAPCA